MAIHQAERTLQCLPEINACILLCIGKGMIELQPMK